MLETTDLNDSYFMYHNESGKEVTISLGAVLFIGEMGGGTTAIILRTGQVIYSRSPYAALVESLEEYQVASGSYGLISILQGDIIQTAEDLKVSSKSFNPVSNKNSEERH